jgi:hypothetical protein
MSRSSREPAKALVMASPPHGRDSVKHNSVPIVNLPKRVRLIKRGLLQGWKGTMLLRLHFYYITQRAAASRVNRELLGQTHLASLVG